MILQYRSITHLHTSLQTLVRDDRALHLHPRYTEQRDLNPGQLEQVTVKSQHVHQDKGA